ncbi:Bile acid sodium symporter [Labilithrix luteola]|uniref:Bile acid sodium symporter n=1 Tax=Labilithrix luteola TaxID=1391654 RepID=A0A0K1PW70_9BACT|nr:bile acid:sodium symporter [Labilithrix luteola]AKU97765.1 Bile acid sodium symporter [Labilithrix luteola]
MLWLLISTYVLGALVPGFGIRIRGLSAGTVTFPLGATAEASMPAFMLGFLLTVAGLATDVGQLKRVARKPTLVWLGLAANTLWPIAFTTMIAFVLRLWSNDVEAQSLLVGLAMAGAMPVAGASATWSQNAEGNIALSLAVVLGSTIASPLLTPLVLHAVAGVTHGDYSEDLDELAQGTAIAFVVLAVVLPSLLGLVLRQVLGARRIGRVMPALKAANLVVLLLLNYSNASLALPGIFRLSNWNFVVLTAVVTACMCAGGFVAGWAMAKRLGAERRDRISITFALGMSNNGSGLVLASSALADHPLVLLPLVLYNLAQQCGAGIVDTVLRRRASPTTSDEERGTRPPAA